MLTMLGSPRRCCDGITRRETLKIGALSALGGFGLPQILAASEAGAVGLGKAKSVINIFLLGGAATQDMYDLKPDAPAEVRSQFQPIATSVPGLQVCEHLPQVAKLMHKVAVIRSLNHKAGCHNTLPCYTGYEVPVADNTITKDSYPPSMGSVCSYLQARDPVRAAGLPDYVYMPCYLGWGQAIRRAGPYGGFLGKQYDALTTECDPKKPDGAPDPLPGTPCTVLGTPRLASSTLPQDITLDRFNTRHSLLGQFDQQQRLIEGSHAVDSYGKLKSQAYDILTSSKLKEAFDLSQEDAKLVERYGGHLFGNSTLMARRLVERGVRFVNVTWDLFWDRVKVDYDAWDTHTRNFDVLKNNKLPGFDQTFSALLEDLDARGLLDETLICVMSEMGRTPHINGNAGRDHWTFCYGALMAGGGIQGGAVHGESDSKAAYVKDKPVSTSDLCSTIYHCLGIDPGYRVPDFAGRPVGISHGGRVIEEILA
jgi:hypothetical protein